MTWRSACCCAGLGLILAAACSRGEHVAVVTSTDDASTQSAAAPRDSRVDAAAWNACLVGDTLLRRVPGVALKWYAAIPFDSLWHGATQRWACRLSVAGHVPPAYAPVDSLIHWLGERGWNARTTISADGPDGTVQGVQRGAVTCLVEGRWDGGDDSDSTYVPSDTIEVHIGCTRSVAPDTLTLP
mgnify:CR=1 FL=1